MKDISKEEFLKNKDKKDATIRRIEIIGEAVENLPEKFTDQKNNVCDRHLFLGCSKMKTVKSTTTSKGCSFHF